LAAPKPILPTEASVTLNGTSRMTPPTGRHALGKGSEICRIVHD
jgi:hypothetical protein